MRRIICSMMVSLDGWMEGPNGEIDWHSADEEHRNQMLELITPNATILLGRVTYRRMADHWPTAPASPLAERMHAVEKVVFSRTLEAVSWNNARLVRGPIDQEVAALRSAPGGDLIILGSATLAAGFLDLGLMDQLQVLVHPVLLGSGRNAFPLHGGGVPLELRMTRVRTSGVVELYYQPTEQRGSERGDAPGRLEHRTVH